MKISTKTRYGLRFMAETSRYFEERTISLKEIAKNQDLSEKYLSQIVIPLRNAGLIIAVRGNSGGYTLSKEPSSMTLLEIFNALEGGTQLVDCTDDESFCNRQSQCPTQWVWEGLSASMKNFLEGQTLEDVKKRITSEKEWNYTI